MKKQLIVLFLIWISVKVYSNEYGSEIYQCYIRGEMVKYKDVLNKMKQTYDHAPSSVFQRQIIRVQYGLVSYYLGAKQDKDAYEEISDAEKRIAGLLKKHPKDASLISMRASFAGFKVILNPFSAVFLGGKLLRDMNKCKSIDFNDRDVLFLHSNSTYYAPSFLGGSKVAGLKNYLKLQSKIRLIDIKNTNDWFALMCLTANAMALVDSNKHADAIKLYNYILTVEPEYDWVRNELIPRAKKKQNALYLEQKQSEKKYQ